MYSTQIITTIMENRFSLSPFGRRRNRFHSQEKDFGSRNHIMTIAYDDITKSIRCFSFDFIQWFWPFLSLSNPFSLHTSFKHFHFQVMSACVSLLLRTENWEYRQSAFPWRTSTWYAVAVIQPRGWLVNFGFDDRTWIANEAMVVATEHNQQLLVRVK